MYFLGTHPQTVDDKGRVVIPARLRPQLSGLQDKLLVVTKWKRRERPCLDVHPFSGWQQIMGRLQAKKRFGTKVSAFESWYTGNAQIVEPDAQWRILLPQVLREYALLEREVVLAGANDRLRIWRKDFYHEVDGADEREIFGDSQLLEELEL